MAATAKGLKMYVGIDVSKARLDVHIHPLGEAFSVSQGDDGHDELVRRLKAHKLAVIAIEATGGYERAVVAALAAAGLPVAVVNPRQVHNFAKALGLNAKTDPLDASVIARFAEAMKLEAKPMRDEETLALAELLARRRQVVQMLAAEKNRAFLVARKKSLQESIGRIIEALESELARLDGDIDGAARTSPQWSEKEELLASVPGVGKVIARTLLAEMPELGTMNRKQVAALAGLAPRTRQSGMWRGKSMIGGGRAVPRTVLFLAAMVAGRYNPDLKAFKLRLLKAGKAKKAVLIAIARKLLTILNAIIRDKTPWSQKTA
jgi:transposase